MTHPNDSCGCCGLPSADHADPDNGGSVIPGWGVPNMDADPEGYAAWCQRKGGTPKA